MGIVFAAVPIILRAAPLARLSHRWHDLHHTHKKSIPRVGRKARTRLDAIKGTVPLPLNFPDRCGFFDRCPRAKAGLCDTAAPPLEEVEPGHLVRCYLVETSRAGGANG